MTLIHFIVFMFFVAILLYLGLKNSAGAASILNAGGGQIVAGAKVLQGR